MAAKTPTKPETNSNSKPKKDDKSKKDAKAKQDEAEKNPYVLPPAEEFWRRYSPHYEAPISGTTSFFFHLLAIFLIVGSSWLLWKLSHNRTLDLQAVRIPGGGGGDPNGRGDAKGIGGGAEEDVTKESKDDTAVLPERTPLNVDQVKAARDTFANDPDANRYISAGNENIESFAKLNKDLQNKLRDGIMPGYGQGGKGSGGGKGTGTGTGTGDGIGSGNGGKLSDREKRMLRWVMIFETQNPSDYVKQLHGLGAIVAVPKGDDYLVVEDLGARPAKLVPKEGGVASLNRIYWVDDKAQSVAGVLNVLQIKQTASHFVAFMPQDLEVKLGEMERNHQGLRDDEIFETKFKVVRSGSGYDVKVQSQQKK